MTLTVWIPLFPVRRNIRRKERTIIVSHLVIPAQGIIPFWNFFTPSEYYFPAPNLRNQGLLYSPWLPPGVEEIDSTFPIDISRCHFCSWSTTIAFTPLMIYMLPPKQRVFCEVFYVYNKNSSKFSVIFTKSLWNVGSIHGRYSDSSIFQKLWLKNELKFVWYFNTKIYRTMSFRL